VRRLASPASGFDADMPKPRPPFLHRQVTQHGRAVWYVRRGKGKRVRLPDEYGTDEFWSAYHAAIAGDVIKTKPMAKTGTLHWLFDRYRESSNWKELSMTTRRARENIFRKVLKDAGDAPFAQIRRADILQGRERRSEHPFAANDFLKAIRGLFGWAVEAQHVENDPTAGVKMIGKEGEGFPTWTEEQIAQFRAFWPIGSRERIAMEVLLHTGLRRGDAARFGRQHVRGNIMSIVTEKRKMLVQVTVLPELLEVIAATPANGLTFITAQNGRPMTKESFGNWFRDICNAAGVTGSAHGLRKAAAVRLAMAGATVPELNAIFGWKGSRMAMKYIEAADRLRLAQSGMNRLMMAEA
jgi:integrase